MLGNGDLRARYTVEKEDDQARVLLGAGFAHLENEGGTLQRQ